MILGPASGRAPAVWLVLAPVLVGSLALIRASWPFTPDDTFITLRYGAHLAAGSGPVFNLDPPRAEGYTSFAWVLATALGELCGVRGPGFAKALGVACAALTTWQVWSLSRALFPWPDPDARRLGGVLAVASVALYVPTAVHAVSGMETTLHAALSTSLVLAAIRASAGSRRWVLALPVLALALGLTRPEANITALLVIGAAWAHSEPELRNRIRKVVVLGYLLPGTLFFAWRWTYYGELLPLPFHLKTAGAAGLPGAEETLRFVLHVAQRWGALMTVGIVLASRHARSIALAAVSWPLLFFLFVHPIMGYEWRFHYSTVPIVAAFAGCGAAVLYRWCRNAFPHRWLAGAVAGAVLVGWIGGTVLGVRATILEYRTYHRGLEHAHVRLGRALAGLDPTAAGSRILAVADAGALPYYSGWHTIDTFGLNDPLIGRTGLHDPDLVLDRSPALVVLLSSEGERFVPLIAWEDLLARSCVRRGYTLQGTLRFKPGYHLFLFTAADASPTLIATVRSLLDVKF